MKRALRDASGAGPPDPPKTGESKGPYPAPEDTVPGIELEPSRGGERGARTITATVREYRDIDLSGGALVVSFPQGAVGNALLTDHLLTVHAMDHLAGVDSDALPPVALVRKGKARFPIRIHADPGTRLAVLRCEVSPHPALARAIAKALLDWVEKKRFARIVILDHIRGDEDTPPGVEAPSLAFVATRGEAREIALKTGARELDDGVLGGVPAMLLLEARFRDLDVTAFFAEVGHPEDAVRSALAFARALPSLVPAASVDEPRIAKEMRTVESAIRSIQEEVDRAVKGMEKRETEETMLPYG